MRCYTAYFPRPEELPDNLKDADFKLGDLKLVDGIKVEGENDAIILGQVPGDRVGLPLSKSRPPEVSDGHIFSGDLIDEDGEQVLALSATTPPRHVTEKAVPILLCVRLFCSGDSKIDGFFRVLAEPASTVLAVGGVAKVGSHQGAFYQDVLVLLEQGGVIQVRPAAVHPPKDFVIRYTGTGINYLTMQDYLSLPP
ncbi:MAG: hypothetical protein WCT25_03645 [Candidatus Paceibacterota bacterium]